MALRRDIQSLTSSTFDVLVVGGGIVGLTIACDAAQRGLSVALVERGDFGSGSSFNHLRTIHGGLRYLQTLDLRRSRGSILERRTLARIAPHTIRPQLFALPLYRSILRGRLAMRAGFLLDRIVSADRNKGVPASHRIPGGRVLSAADSIEQFPGLRRQGLTGAATWVDYITVEADRLTISWAIQAAAHGATLANYVEAAQPISDGKRVTGVRAVDRIDGRNLEIAARLVVNATGGGLDMFLTSLGLAARQPVLKAMNLVTRREASGAALGGITASGRSFFLIPWRSRALFGTWESNQPARGGDRVNDEADVVRFIAELNQAFPSLELTLQDVSLVHRGIVPAVERSDGTLTLEGRDRMWDHAPDGIEGLVSVAGTKYTVARAVAERATDVILAKLKREAVPCRTASTPLPGGDITDVDGLIGEARREFDATLPSDAVPHLVSAYGTRYRDVLEDAGGSRELRTRVVEDSPVIGAQILWAARQEMATTLSDAVIRRTPLGALGYPGDAAAEKAADIMAVERAWPDDRKRRELAELRAFYTPL